MKQEIIGDCFSLSKHLCQDTFVKSVLLLWKCSTNYVSGSASNTQEQNGLTTKNRLVTTGETVGSSGRCHGSGWASTPTWVFCEEDAHQSYRQAYKEKPPGDSERKVEDEIPKRMDSKLKTQGNEQPTMMNTIRCTCGKLRKNEHGLKIHMVRMKCTQMENKGQCTGTSPGEMQEPSWELPLRAQNLQAL